MAEARGLQEGPEKRRCGPGVTLEQYGRFKLVSRSFHARFTLLGSFSLLPAARSPGRAPKARGDARPPVFLSPALSSDRAPVLSSL